MSYFYIFFLILFFSCKADPSAFFFHDSTNERVYESINEVKNIPVPILVDTTNFSFAVFGDIHITEENINYLYKIKQDASKLNTKFCVVVGDLTDHGLEIEYKNSKQSLDSMNLPYYQTIGNHELYNKNGWEYWKEYYGPSCYSLTFSNYLKIIFLDSAEGLIGSSQFQWLENELKTNTTPFTIIASHYPLYDDLLPSIWRLPSADERYKLIALMRKYHVDAYVSGHLHTYAYTNIYGINHFVTGSMCPFPLDKGTRGYLLLTITNGTLSWKKIEV